MAKYRLYLLSGSLGQIDSYKEFDCRSDEEAIEIAEGFRGRERMELWSGGQRVMQFASVRDFTASSSKEARAY